MAWVVYEIWPCMHNTPFLFTWCPEYGSRSCNHNQKVSLIGHWHMLSSEGKWSHEMLKGRGRWPPLEIPCHVPSAYSALHTLSCKWVPAWVWWLFWTLQWLGFLWMTLSISSISFNLQDHLCFYSFFIPGIALIMCLLLETLHVWCWSADWMTKCCHLCPNISALQHRVWSATMQHGRLEAVGPSIWNSHHTLLPLFPPLFKKWLKTIYFGLTVVRERPHVMSYFEDRLHKK